MYNNICLNVQFLLLRELCYVKKMREHLYRISFYTRTKIRICVSIYVENIIDNVIIRTVAYTISHEIGAHIISDRETSLCLYVPDKMCGDNR